MRGGSAKPWQSLEPIPSTHIGTYEFVNTDPQTHKQPSHKLTTTPNDGAIHHHTHTHTPGMQTQAHTLSHEPTITPKPQTPTISLRLSHTHPSGMQTRTHTLSHQFTST